MYITGIAPVLFPGDDIDEIFSSKPSAAGQLGRGDSILNKSEDKVKPEPAPVIPIASSATSAFDGEPLPNNFVPALESATPSEAVPDPPDSPLFSNQPDLDDVHGAKIPSVSPPRPHKTIPNRPPPPPLFKSWSKTTSLKTSSVKSIFADSDSDDDLFKSSSSKAKVLQLKSQGGNPQEVSATLTTKVVFNSSSSSDEDGSLSDKSKKNEAVSCQGKDTASLDGLLDPSTAPFAESNQSEDAGEKYSGTAGNEAKSFVKSIAHSLKINPLALKPGGKMIGPHSSKSSVTSPSAVETKSFSSGALKPDIEAEIGVSFDDSLTSSTLLHNVAKVSLSLYIYLIITPYQVDSASLNCKLFIFFLESGEGITE